MSYVLTDDTYRRLMGKLGEHAGPGRGVAGGGGVRQQCFVRVTGAAVSGWYPAVVTDPLADGTWVDRAACQVARENGGAMTTGYRYPAQRTGDHTDGTPRFVTAKAGHYVAAAGLSFTVTTATTESWTSATLFTVGSGPHLCGFNLPLGVSVGTAPAEGDYTRIKAELQNPTGPNTHVGAVGHAWRTVGTTGNANVWHDIAKCAVIDFGAPTALRLKVTMISNVTGLLISHAAGEFDSQPAEQYQAFAVPLF